MLDNVSTLEQATHAGRNGARMLTIIQIQSRSNATRTNPGDREGTSVSRASTIAMAFTRDAFSAVVYSTMTTCLTEFHVISVCHLRPMQPNNHLDLASHTHAPRFYSNPAATLTEFTVTAITS